MFTKARAQKQRSREGLLDGSKSQAPVFFISGVDFTLARAEKIGRIAEHRHRYCKEIFSDYPSSVARPIKVASPPRDTSRKNFAHPSRPVKKKWEKGRRCARAVHSCLYVKPLNRSE